MTAAEYVEELVSHVRRLLDAGMSQAHVTKAAGVDPMTISRLLNSRMMSVEVQTYFAILAVTPPA